MFLYFALALLTQLEIILAILHVGEYLDSSKYFKNTLEK
jgi:hypothetical protein